MPYKDPQKRKEYNKEYQRNYYYVPDGYAQSEKCKEKRYEREEKNRGQITLKHNNWAKSHRPQCNKWARDCERKRRMKVLIHYGDNPPKCACCGESTYEFLAIDHVNNNGAQHRRQIGRSRFYSWLINNNFPEGYQILCHNCNCAKGFYGECPHKRRRSDSHGR